VCLAVTAEFLRADSFALDTARERLRACLAWRAAADVDALGAPGADLGLGAAFAGHDVLRGHDRDARPLVISRFGTMDVDRVFGDAEQFLLWRVQLMERAVAQLPLERGAPETLCQVHDYADCAVIGQDRRITEAIKLFSQCMGAYYPELKGKTLLINVPDVYAILFRAASAFMPSRTVAKFTLCGSAYHETLYGAVSPEHIPARYGGLRRDGDDATADAAATASAGDDVWAGSLPATVLSVPARGVAAHGISLAGPGGGGVAARRRLIRWRFRVPDGEVRATVVIDGGGDGIVDGVAATGSTGADKGTDGAGGGDGVAAVVLANETTYVSADGVVCGEFVLPSVVDAAQSDGSDGGGASAIATAAAAAATSSGARVRLVFESSAMLFSTIVACQLHVG
jgi:hypothetical protein